MLGYVFGVNFRLTMAAIAFAAVVAAYAVGRVHGDYLAELAHAHERAAAEREIAHAIAQAHERVAQADAAAAEQRATAQALARQVTRERNARLAALPPADCTVPDDRRMLVANAYCDRFPGAPACVSGAVRAVPDRATDDKPGAR